jgi:hypothetical protein
MIIIIIILLYYINNYYIVLLLIIIIIIVIIITINNVTSERFSYLFTLYALHLLDTRQAALPNKMSGEKQQCFSSV